MNDDELFKMLDGLTILSQDEEAQRPAKPQPRKLRKDGTQAPDPNSNTSKKKERKRLEARTPSQVRKEEMLAERERLKKLAEKANVKRVAERIDDTRAYQGIRRKHAQQVALTKKRLRNHHPDK